MQRSQNNPERSSTCTWKGIKRKHQCHVKGLGSWKDFEIGRGGQGLARKQLRHRQRLPDAVLVDECRVSVAPCLRPPGVHHGAGLYLEHILRKFVCWCYFSDIIISHYDSSNSNFVKSSKKCISVLPIIILGSVKYLLGGCYKISGFLEH